MIDFTSSLFLGPAPAGPGPACRLPLTTGRAAPLAEPPIARVVARRMAALQHAEAGVLHRSALHALIDVIVLATSGRRGLVVDEFVYPLAAVAADVAARRGALLVRYRHHDPADAVRRCAGVPDPVVLTDGWCAGCGCPAPLVRLQSVARRAGGRLVVDDTQACGVLGRDPDAANPFGSGGGGTMLWSGGRPDRTVQLSSLAKAFGAPLAVSTGPAPFVRRLAPGDLRWHASPPTAADLAAADVATRDPRWADRRRRRLVGLVARFRSGLARLGHPVAGPAFPLVCVPGRADTLAAVRERLLDQGVRAMVTSARCRPGVVLTFAVTAAHRPDDVDTVLRILARSRPFRRTA